MRPRRVSEGAALRRLLASAFLLLLGFAAGAVHAATAPGTEIANTATAGFGVFARRTVASPTVRFEVEADDGDDGGTPVGDPPTDIVLDDPRVPEDTPGAVVGRLTVLDPDAGDSHVFAVDDPRFVVEDDAFRLADGVALDFEAEPLVRVAVTATDPEGLSVTSIFAVVVEDRAEFTAVPCAEASGTPGPGEARVCENAPGALLGLFDLPDGYDAVRPLDPRFTGDTGGRLRLRTDVALDHEAQAAIDLVVELLGDGGVREQRTLRVAVVDRPEAPSVEAVGPLSVPEGVAGAEAGGLRIADPDAGDAVVATVDDPRFEVVGDRLRLRPDEAVVGPGPIPLRVTVTDRAGLVGEAAFEVAIAARNDAPVLPPLETGVAAGAPVGTVIDRLRATDADPEDTLAFAVVAEEPAGFFALDAVTGELRVADARATADADRSFVLRVRVTDDNGSGDPAGPRSAEAEVRIRVTGTNTAPRVTDLVLAPVDEHAPAGTVLATLGAEDPDAPLAWSIVSGDPAGAFALDPATGVLSVAAPEALDFEAGPVRELVIAVTDAGAVPLTALQRVTVPLVDRNEAPVFTTARFAVVENAPVGTAVGRVRVRDPDTVAGDEARLELVGGSGAGVFALDAVTGLLTVADRSVLDFEATGAFTLELRATDANASGDPSGRRSVEATYAVSVLDVNEAPTELRLAATVAAPGVAGAAIGALTVRDPDLADTHRLLLDDPRFEVVPAAAGPLAAASAASPKQVAGAAPVTRADVDYPAGTLRLVDGAALAAGERVELTITAVDQGGLSASRVFPIATEPGTRSRARLTFLKAPAAARAPGFPASVAAVTALSVEPARCAVTDALAGPFADGPALVGLDGAALALPAELALTAPATNEGFALGEPVFLQLDDADADRDDRVRERVAVRVELPATGDVEVVELVETALASGRFVGVVATSGEAGAAGDCVLAAGRGAALLAHYTDPGDGGDRAEAASVVAPITRVFDAATGRPVDGVRLRLVDAATGEPAGVRGDAPFPAWPQTLVSGDEAEDGEGGRETFAPGTVRFPAVPAGRWRLEVTTPNRFRFPSAVEDGALAALPGAPWTVGAAGRGRSFELPVGPALRVDVPLDVVDLGATPSRLELFAYAEGDPAATATGVAPTACAAGPVARPRDGSGALLELPAALSLAPANGFRTGEHVFLRVIDRDADLDPFAADRVAVTLEVEGGGAPLQLVLTETGASTGRFTGHVPVGGAGTCALAARPDASLLARYVDADDGADVSTAEATLDPSARVFDAATGAPVDGVRVTLVDADTGAPATVRTADGVAAWPSTIVTGQSFTDGAGNPVDLGPGRFRFPRPEPGRYRLEVVAPEAFRFPSTAEDGALAALDGGPFALAAGSRGEAFPVTGAGLPRLDVPLDPVRVELFLSKQARSPSTAIGDFLPWEIRVQNPSGFALADVVLEDVLPPGFRLEADSLAADAPDATVAVADDGRTLSIHLPSLAAGSTVAVRYVTEVTAGARLGEAVNRVRATGPGVRGSNVAEARVAVREDLLRDRAVLLGRVLSGGCEVPAGEASGVAGVRLYLEDGTYVVTDRDGRWHVEGVRPGTHVVQLDAATLPDGLEPVLCEAGNRAGGTAFSRFVDVQGGTLWRTDFRLRTVAPEQAVVRQALAGSVRDDGVALSLTIDAAGARLTELVQSVMVPAGLRYVPGSTVVDGRAAADPESSGDVLTWRAPGLDADATRELRFLLAPSGAIEDVRALPVRAMALFRDATGARHRLPVATLEVRGDATSPATALPVANADEASARTARVLAAAGEAGVRSRRLQQGAALAVGAVARTETALDAPEPETEEAAEAVPAFADQGLPEFTAVDVAAHPDERAFLWPSADFLPRIPATWVAVKHAPDAKAKLLVNGLPVSPLQFERTDRWPEQGVALSVWRGVTLEEGANRLEARIEQGGTVVETLVHTVRFSGAPVRAELVPEASRLVADGVEAPVLAVRFHDRDGYLVRPGMTGRFEVTAPYRPRVAEDTRTRVNLNENVVDQGVFQVRRDGVAYLQLEPTTVAGQGELSFAFSEQRQDRVRFRLAPAMRDWILVGFAEGTAAWETLSGNMVSARDAGLGEDWLGDGRVAFFAKGAVAGRYLLTVAYDSDKPGSDQLGNLIDPNRYYTLYADGSEQRWEAESQRKLYLKLERGAFQALFGDYDTDLTVTELGRFARRMTGLQVDYEDDRWTVDAFASEADQAFVRDDLRGDGTSGLYRLREDGVLPNSERVRIEVRDRLRTERVLETRTLTRFTDYAIDYDAGTLLFREPVQSQDAGFNPIFVVVEYETAGAGRRDVVGGGRIARRFGEAGSEVGVTAVHDGSTGREQTLAALDATVRLGERTELRAEGAWSRAETEGGRRDGSAWLLEAEHAAGGLRASAYAREQRAGFGVGQQFAGNGGMRRFGAAVTRDLAGPLDLTAEAWQEENLDSGAVRQVTEARAAWQDDTLRLASGLRSVRESRADGGDLVSDLATASLGRDFLGGRVRLTGDAEYALGGEGENIDFPTRLGVGAEYRIFSGLDAFARQDWTFADARDTQDTRVGVDARPWNGATLGTSVGRRFDEEGERLFATTGLVQNVRLGEHWSVDVGLDRETTLRDDRGLGAVPRDDPQNRNPGGFNPAVPPVFGTASDDFVAGFLGAGYRREAWEGTARVERRVADREARWNLLAGLAHQLDDGRILSARLEFLQRDEDRGARSRRMATRVGAAWRPAGSRWTVLNRLDLVLEERDEADFDSATGKVVNNLSANFRPDERSQLSLSWGLKYVLAEIDGETYGGVTDLYGFEYRRDFARRWDLGLHGGALHSWNASVVDWQSGASIGHSPARNVWVSVGWNFTGFEDGDFAAADFSSTGPFVRFRMKIDQDSVRDYLGALPFALR